MTYNQFYKTYRFLIIALGLIVLIYALLGFPPNILTVDFLSFLAITLLIAPYMSLRFPKAKHGLSFSDSLIFLSFLLYGGKAAVLVAASGMLASCLRMKWKKLIAFRRWMISSNIAASAISSSIAFAAYFYVIGILGIKHQSQDTNSLLPALGILALIHFLATSLLRLPFSRNFGKHSVWKIWATELFPLSLGYIAGAAFALIIYKSIYQLSFMTVGVAIVLFVLFYLNYKKSLSDVEESIKQAEKAELEKAAIAKIRAEESEKYSKKLGAMLQNEEEISEELRRSKDGLEYSAFHDALTDLANRTYLMERLKFLIELDTEIPQQYFMVFVDLSRFKNINDSLGHSVGDQVLKIVSLRLRRVLRDTDSITRLGGDEFAVILANLSTIEKAYKVAEKIYDSITKPFIISGNTIYSDLHVGIAPLDPQHIRPEEIIRDAGIAMQHAKDKKLGIATFTTSIKDDHLERIRIETDLHTAVKRGEFSIHYQPIISLETGVIVGFEALLRWIHPEHGFISPAQFIPISEESGSIIPITNWILKETCSQLAKWNKTLNHDEQMFVSVNISGRHFSREDLVRDVKRALRSSGLASKLLKLEVTETAAMENAESAIQVLQKLNDLGILISIDDFGTGYSSLSYLHRLPFDTLKVDRSFIVSASEGGEEDLKILESIVSLAKGLNKNIVAEGIETEEQLSMLQDLGSQYGQGYLFSKPLPRDKAAELLKDPQPWLEFDNPQMPEGDPSRIHIGDPLRSF